MRTQESFAALRADDGLFRYPLTEHELGEVHVPSGLLEVADPYTQLGEGTVVRVPAGSHPVHVTVADVSDDRDGSDLREAVLTVTVADGTPVRLDTPHPAKDVDQPGYVGVSVDAGTVGFADAAATRRANTTPSDDPRNDDQATAWTTEQDAASPLPVGSANVSLTGEPSANVVLTRSGKGDGFYPILATYDAENALVAVHVDFKVASE